MKCGDLLHESVASASPSFLFLQLDEFELTERFKDILKILLGNAEMYVANIETMEGD